MKTVPFALVVAGLAVGLTLAEHRDARAIAAFSREYSTECVTCHNPFPRRNAFGEAFEKNGHVWPGREQKTAPDGQEALWLSGLPRTLPLSGSLWSDVKYNAEEETDKVAPSTALSLQAGGSIQDRLGFFAHDLTASGGEAFGMFRRVMDTPFHVKFGRFTPKTTLWKANQTFTLTLPAPLSFAVPNGGGPLVTPRDAVEVNAVLAHRWFLAGGVADRKNQDGMECYGHLSYRVGGTDFLGEEPEVDFDVDSIWDYLAVTLGGFGYYGTIEMPTYETRYWRAGAEAEATYKGFTFILSGVVAKDRDIDGTGTEVESAVFAAEVDYYFAPKFLLAGRVENEDVGNAATGVRKRLIAQGTYLWNQNVALRLEGAYQQGEYGQDPSGSAAQDRDPNSITGWLRVDIHI